MFYSLYNLLRPTFIVNLKKIIFFKWNCNFFSGHSVRQVWFCGECREMYGRFRNGGNFLRWETGTVFPLRKRFNYKRIWFLVHENVPSIKKYAPICSPNDQPKCKVPPSEDYIMKMSKRKQENILARALSAVILLCAKFKRAPRGSACCY